jgi:hypothetical protein
MSTCFVIQPFDQGPFDKRFDDIFQPAISAAHLEAYRVDRDPRVSIPIEEIEAGIRNAEVCLAEITTDNPNVWFELGFAIASQREVVLVCSSERRSRFPFDIQHRSVINYDTESSSDFETLKGRITERLVAILSKEERILQATKLSPVADVQGLAQHEMVTLVAIAENLETPDGTVSVYMIRQSMEKAGFKRIAVTLGLGALLKKDMISAVEEHDFSGEPYTSYQIKPSGMAWLETNQDRLVLQEEVQEKQMRAPF